ncbi:GNAT family N-acetyltransferase [Streptomyces sp. NPDC052682]|uniref:GNAT family N-acetyltransferase n=1 Tax=Streptomyces sp. NPDC052682 TaxID=3154954 RepID=UPI00341876D4
MTAPLRAAATPSAPALALRPWSPGDAAPLVEIHRDAALRRWTSTALDDEASAARWIRDQQSGWREGRRYGFAVVEPREGGAGERLVGNVVLKGVSPGAPSAEVGYWTASAARGRGVAPRALRALTAWAFATFAAEGLTRLELVHQVDNTASCRVAEKSAYGLAAVLPASPPAFPLEGHVHVCVRE